VHIAGTVAAAALYAILGIGWIFIINGVAYIGSAISEKFITVKTKEESDTPLTFKSMFVDMGKGFGYLFNNRGLFVFALFAVILNFFMAPLYSIGLPYLYNQVLQTDPLFYSLIGAVASVGTIIMSIIFTLIKQRDKIYRFVIIGLMVWLPLLTIQTLLIYLVINHVISFAWFFGLSIAISLIDGMIGVFINTPVGVAFQKYVPKDMLGRVNSMLNTIVAGLMPIAIALGGIFLEYRSVIELYMIGLVGFIIAGIIFLSSKSVKQL